MMAPMTAATVRALVPFRWMIGPADPVPLLSLAPPVPDVPVPLSLIPLLPWVPFDLNGLVGAELYGGHQEFLRNLYSDIYSSVCYRATMEGPGVWFPIAPVAGGCPWAAGW